MTWPTTRWPTAQEIADRLRELAGDPRYASICTVTDFDNPTSGGFLGNFVRIGTTTPANRPSVVFIGGVHAREWAPPTILTNLISGLLEAYDRRRAITTGSTTRSDDDVRAIVNSVSLYIAPLVNPDGYDFSRTTDSSIPLAGRKDRGWRKNRRPAPADANIHAPCVPHDPMNVGVDINRNFDVLWKFRDFYVDEAIAAGKVSVSADTCEEIYRGPDAFSEPESRNVKKLLETAEPQVFVDVHMHGRSILYSWGTEENERVSTVTPTLNPGKVRDATLLAPQPGFTGYKEPINTHHLDDLDALANLMADATQAATAHRYDPQPATDLYATTGASDDYAASRNLGTARAMTKAFTIECGESFLPLFASELPAIQNEVQAALLAVLRKYATASAAPTSGSTSAPSHSCVSCSVAGSDPESDV